MLLFEGNTRKIMPMIFKNKNYNSLKIGHSNRGKFFSICGNVYRENLEQDFLNLCFDEFFFQFQEILYAIFC